MTTIKLRHRGSLIGPLPTFDAIDSARFGDTALAEIRQSLGDRLDADDLTRIEAILQKYVGGSSSVNALGVARAGDAADVGRRSAAVARANAENNAKVVAGYRNFWNPRNRELADSIRR